MYEAKKITYKILVENLEGKIPLGRNGRRWNDNIKVNLREIGSGGVDRIHLAEDRDQWWILVKMTINYLVPLSVEKFLSSRAKGGF
jgi:hypothetical protein